MSRRVALLALVAAPLAAQGTIAPELPRAVPSTAMPTQTGTVHTVQPGGDVQAAITEAEPGDVLEFPCAGATYSGNYSLPDKGASTAWVILRPACWASLPPAGTRITPAIAAALHLPRFVSPNSQAVFSTNPRAHHYRIMGLEVTLGYPGGTNTLFSLGSDAQTTLAEIPHDLVLDRLYMHGTPTGSLRRCIALNSAWTAIVESTCTEVHEAGADNQAIMGWTGPGPYLIRGNELEAGAEVIMFGGGDPRIVGLVPSDITVQRNHITRPVAWKGVIGVKNLFELKNARRVLVEGNVIENNWAWGQDGSGVVLKSTDQDGTCPWCGTSHVTVRRNVVRNVGGAFNLAAHPESAPVEPMHDVAITDNVVANVRTETFTGPGQAWFIQQNIHGLTIAHNTVVTRGQLGAFVLMPNGTPLMELLTIRDNLTSSDESNNGLYGDNAGGGLAALAQYAPTATVTGNVFGGSTFWIDITNYDRQYPPGNYFTRSLGGVGVADSTITSRLDTASVAALLASVRLRTASPFVGKASDGKDPGADVAAVAASTAGVVDGAGGAPTPAPAPVLSAAQLRAAITAMDKVVSASGRENAATKAALAPVAVYLHALLGATP